MSEDALSIRYVRALVDGVEHRGVSRSQFLEAAGWDHLQLEIVEGRVACAEVGRLVELAIDLTGDAALGLHTLEAVKPDSVDLVGRLVAYAANVRQALDWLFRLHRLMGTKPRFQLLETSHDVTLRYEGPAGLSERAHRALTEMHVAGKHRLLRYFNKEARPLRVCFEYAAPAYESEYQRIFAGAERFDQPRTGIVFDQALMGAARRYHDEEFYQSLAELGHTRVLRLDRGVSCVDRVNEFLATHAAPGKVNLDGVAQALAMSPRSLRRRLAAEGTSYGVVVNEALASRARRLLSVEQRTIEEAAHAMGYSERSAFHRAFKRWTGTTPQAWRHSRKPQGLAADGGIIPAPLADERR
jgi:AraC-like DNA-binding protein